MEILKVHNLSVNVFYNNYQHVILDNITFSLNHGETLGILGESGSGKTITALTILQLLSSSLTIYSGEILYKGLDVLRLSEKEMKTIRGGEIAMIFQEPMTSLNPVLTCGNQIMECVRLYYKLTTEKAKKRALELIHEVKLPEPERIFKSYPHQLSGGQRQRIMIAMAISGHPKILIADEPTTALDVTVQKSILELLVDLQKVYGLSILFISHDIGVIEELASRILVMRNGKIIEQGNKDEIIKTPVNPYTKALLACRPPMRSKPKRLPTLQDIEKVSHTKIEMDRNTIRNTYHNASVNVILSVENLRVNFSKSGIIKKSHSIVEAVKGVNFQVYQRETLGLVGESGSGKTTIGRAIMQLVEIYSGNIKYRNIKLNALNEQKKRKIRTKIQLIFQDPYASLNPKISIGKAIMEPMIVHEIHTSKKQREARVIELLEKVGLSASVFYCYPHEFSGGQRQRVVIARALAMNPELIICDESVSALDVSIQAQVLNLLNDLKDELGLTYIFISHDLAVVKYMSERIIVLNEGSIEEINTAENIFNTPQSDYTKQLIHSIPKNQ